MQNIQKLFTINISEKEKEKNFEKFDKKLTSKLASASNAKSWSDLLPIMKDILSFLNLNFDYDFNNISDKLLLGKRLAQSLNPECPSGLHEVSLDVYELILNNIIKGYKDKLMDNLHIYSYGLFPFFPNATLQNKRKFLEKIVKKTFYQLNNVELKLCLPGLLSSLIPGLDDNNEENTKMIYSSFDDLAKKDERSFFGVYWMLLLRCKHLRGSGIKYLLEKIYKYSYIKSQEENKQKEIIEKQFPNINITVVNALSEIIKDNDIPLVRNGMDFIMSRLPLTKENNLISDEAKINLINSAVYLFVKNDYSCIRRLKSWILGINDSDDDVNFESEDMKYKMGLVIEAFKIVFKQNKNQGDKAIKNNIIIFERFLDLEEEFANQTLSSLAYLILKSVVSYWEEQLESSEEKRYDPIISQMTKFFYKNEIFLECLWNSLAESINQVEEIKKLDEVISPLKFCLSYIDINSKENRIKWYVPIISNLLKVIKKIPLKREEIKIMRKVIFIALAYTKSLQQTKFQDIEQNDDKKEDNKNNDVSGSLYGKTDKNDWTHIDGASFRKSVLVELVEDESNTEENLTDVYKISEEYNLKSILNYDKNLVEKLSQSINNYQEYYIGILNEFLNFKNDRKNNQINRFEYSFFKQIAELTIRLQEYCYIEENENQNDIPNWIKYLEKIIFNYNDASDNLLSIEAANILLDLNLSSFTNNNNIFKRIRDNFYKEDIDTQIIDVSGISEIVQKMKVKPNCFELLVGKFYLLSNKQSHMNSIMEIMLKIYCFDKNKFGNIIDETLNIKENLHEYIKLFSNFWKSVNDYYPEKEMFQKETIFKMVDFLEDRNPRFRHLAKTWLNQANQHFNKILEPILLVLLNSELIFEKKENDEESTEFIKEFDVSKILDAFNKLKLIIINSQIMPFLKNEIKDDMSMLIKFKKYEAIRLSYLQALISTLLHFIRTKSKDNLNEDFKREVLSLNVAATEFLEFLLKNINDYRFLIKNTDLINKTILNLLSSSLKQEDEVMPVQLLDVLKTLYFSYSPEIFQLQSNKDYYIRLLTNGTLANVLKDGMIFDHFYIREHFISFTKTLVESFFNAISIEDTTELKNFYNLCNRFIEPLSQLLAKKVKIQNKPKTDTEKFSHFDANNNQIIFKNYCEEYKEYKTYDESEVMSILKGINDIISNCFKNKIQEKNKEKGTDKGIKFFYIPIPFIKKKAIQKSDFKGDWAEQKKKMANDLKTNNAFVSFMTTIFDFVDENPNKEIKDMSTDLYHNQIFNLLKSFLAIWINQSDKYHRYDYCLNGNGTLAATNLDRFKNYSEQKIAQIIDNINNNPIKSLIINIAVNLFITDSVKFIDNIITLWCNDGVDFSNDKQYKLSIIELLISMDIPVDIILFCIGACLQKSFSNNNLMKKYQKSKPDKCYITPFDVSIKEAKIFHFLYSYVLLNPKRYAKKTEKDKNEIIEIWKEIINIMNNTLNETKILYSQCWLYEILNLAIRKYPASNIDNREIKNGIENVFNNITNKLMDAVFSKKTDSKYINNELFVLPFLPHVYTNISKELYKDDDLYHKNAEGSKNIHSNFNRKTFLSKISLDNIEKKKSYFDEVNTSQNGLNARSKTLLPEKGPKSEAEEVQNSINAFYKSYVKVAQYSSEYCTTKNIPPDIKTKLENQQNIYINDYYQGLAFITLEENFYSLIKSIFGDNLTNVKKFYTEIINKLLSKIKSTQNKKEFFTEYSHHFLVNLIKNSSKNISIVGKEPFMEYIKSPMFFTGSPNVLHGWKIIIELLSENYSEILHDLLVDIEDKNIFVKKTEEEKGRILRRVSFVIYSRGKDKFNSDFGLIKSKAKEILTEFSNNNFLEREIFLTLRMLFLRFSHDAVMQMIRDLWPIIFTELVKNINNYIKENADESNKKKRNKNINLIIEPFKFIELLSLVNIEEFSLYQWIFMMDTFDISDCDVRIDSLLKTLLLDKKKLFKPLAFEIVKQRISDLNDDTFEGKHKGKSELYIDSRDESTFIDKLTEFFYSIGDMNSFKVEANYPQIEENIEKDFIDKNKSNKKEKKNNDTNKNNNNL